MLQAEQVLQEQYQLKQPLGNNASRQTWLAEDLETSELVVVKLLTLGPGVQWQDFKLFEREAQVLQSLDHPRIPCYRDFFTIDDNLLWLGLVQDYIPGQSLAELLAQGDKFTETEIRQIAVQVLKILIYLHELNPPVLHRDIKPSNLLLGEDGHMYLVDFGAVQEQAGAVGKTFTVVGTYGYTPIEQFGGRAVPASDLYALGATLIHLLTGAPPADLPQEEMRIAFWSHTSASRELVDWVYRLTEPSVERRFKTAREALEALEQGKTLGRRSGALSAVPAPAGTRVILCRDREKLSIEIPEHLQGLSAVDIAVTSGILLIVALIADALIFKTLFLLVILGLLGPLVLGFLGAASVSQSVTFNADTFRIVRSVFGVTVYERWGNTIEIESVGYQVQVTQNNALLRSSPASIFRLATIQTSEGRYMFGGYLTEDEVNWLVQEIQNWLRIYA